MQGDVCEAVAAAKADLRAAAGVLTSQAHVSTPAEGAGHGPSVDYAHVFSHAHSAGQVVMPGDEEQWDQLHGDSAHTHAGHAHVVGPMQSDDSDSSNAAMQSSGTTLSLTHPSHSLPHPGSTRLGEWGGVDTQGPGPA